MERVCGLLIRLLFPADFRLRYLNQVLAAICSEQRRPENQGLLGRTLFVHETFGDLILVALRLRLAQARKLLAFQPAAPLQYAASGGHAGISPPSMEEHPMTSANDRLKERASGHLWLALILSTGLHAAAFWAFPSMTAAVEGPDPAATTIIAMPDLPLPPPPEAVRPPAKPVPVAGASLDAAPPGIQEIWDEPAALPPPPPGPSTGAERPPVWTGPLQINPRITNRAEVARALEALYPPLLRDSGIGGRVLVKFFLLEDGTVLERGIVESSGHGSLDQAALGVADVMRFSPAYNRESPVPVWVSLPIEFTVRNR